MSISETFFSIFVVFLSAILALLISKKFSKNLGLMDVARQHKSHSGSIPLVGGISIFTGILIGQFLISETILDLNIFFFSASVIFLMGLLDDRFDLAVMPRFILQILAVTIMISDSSSVLTSFGDLLGSGSINLELLSFPITIIAVIGVINALNMVDGIDGLAAGLSLVTIGSIILMPWSVVEQPRVLIAVVLFVSIIPYLLFNLGLFGKSNKIFLGDSGSMLIGFILAWLLISLSQGGESKRLFAPVTALWIFAIPLVDTVSIMIRRIIKKQSPFHPDREHLHHIVIRMGYTDKHALGVIIILSVILATIGIWMELNDISEFTSFKLFLVFLFIYLLILLRIWKMIKFFHTTFPK
jgi:UDP-GlcNAc:undecaprenyl-phosphate GlcNAc-1-phosphate transferase